ncbi:MAG TPA: S46 family peptidase [Vicinamibacterales bacterium]|nr:S46 family peptidase [Vicinamibacterales bacterium]
MTRLALALALCAAAATAVVLADEGMWTTHNFPREAVKQKYNVDIDDKWLQTLQRSIVRLETGCTGSFVSPDGLILTNHHCAQTCIAENSSANRDLVANGFVSPDRAEEIKCQGEAISVLIDAEDVTAAVTKAMTAASAADAARVRNETLTTLESGCEEAAKKSGTPLTCESVSLYQGGQYWLYKYKRYDDVRLAFAPEQAVAAFGGDPDNFQFPRWCLDMSLLRAYENGKPAVTPSHLRFNWAGAREKDPVFVAGHPGTTQRLLTVAQLKTERDLVIPFWLLRFSELRGRLIQYSKSSPEAARTAKDFLDTIENSIKVRRQQLFALLDDRLMDQKAAEEQKLRALVKADPALASRAGGAWDDIARAQAKWRDIYIPYVWLEGGAAFNSDLFALARQIVRAADERARPNTDRMREYTEARLPALRQAIAAETPIYPEFEQVRLSFSLERMREWLGPDHPMVKAVLGTASPDERARALISASKLADPKTRLALFDGGQKAVQASTDPMIQAARTIDAEARRLRTIFETEVDGPVQRAQQLIAEARFKALGTNLYPDATFTLRVTYGAVEGWLESGAPVEPFTRLTRMYERTTGQAPFALPKRWLDARARLDPATRANFVATTDIVGGNSGSPMVNAAGEIVGLVFDGNIHSIAGSYWFDADKNRTVAVHPDFIRTALSQIYPSKALAAELGIR